MEQSGGLSSTADRVMSILERVAETHEVRRNPELRLFDLGIIDSLATVELPLALSEEFGVDISPAELDREEWATPGQIVQFMVARVGG